MFVSIFFRRVPAPEIALSRLIVVLQKIRLRFENRRIIEPRSWNFEVSSYIPSTARGHAKCPIPGPPVAVLRMAGVEPHVEREGLSLGVLIFHEFDSAIDDQLRLVPQAAVRHVFCRTDSARSTQTRRNDPPACSPSAFSHATFQRSQFGSRFLGGCPNTKSGDRHPAALDRGLPRMFRSCDRSGR